jgi:hypothetical protein
VIRLFHQRTGVLEPLVLDPPATEAELRWWRRELRRAVGWGLAKTTLLFGIAGLGLLVSDDPSHWWLHAARHPTFLMLLVFGPVFLGLTGIRPKVNAVASIWRMRLQDGVDARKADFLAALDEPSPSELSSRASEASRGISDAGPV